MSKVILVLASTLLTLSGIGKEIGKIETYYRFLSFYPEPSAISNSKERAYKLFKDTVSFRILGFEKEEKDGEKAGQVRYRLLDTVKGKHRQVVKLGIQAINKLGALTDSIVVRYRPYDLKSIPILVGGVENLEFPATTYGMISFAPRTGLPAIHIRTEDLNAKEIESTLLEEIYQSLTNFADFSLDKQTINFDLKNARLIDTVPVRYSGLDQQLLEFHLSPAIRHKMSIKEYDSIFAKELNTFKQVYNSGFIQKYSEQERNLFRKVFFRDNYFLKKYNSTVRLKIEGKSLLTTQQVSKLMSLINDVEQAVPNLSVDLVDANPNMTLGFTLAADYMEKYLWISKDSLHTVVRNIGLQQFDFAEQALIYNLMGVDPFSMYRSSLRDSVLSDKKYFKLLNMLYEPEINNGMKELEYEYFFLP